MLLDNQTTEDEKSHCAIKSEPCLYVVATPIGNLGDFSLRARHVLTQVDRIAAEDTRNTGRMLSALGIRKPLMAHHAHNERESAQGIVACLQQGESVALVSDAGTPAVSDPGAVVVAAVAEAGFTVVPVPGASSVLAVVAASGLVEGAFTFRGFLPSKGKAREQQLSAWLQQAEPQVIFEAPHRIHDLFALLLRLNADERLMCAGREMTKQFETFYRGTVREVAALVTGDSYAEKGEWALVLAGKSQFTDVNAVEQDEDEIPGVWSGSLDLKGLIESLLAQTSPKSVTQIVVQATGLPKNKVYRWVQLLAAEH